MKKAQIIQRLTKQIAASGPRLVEYLPMTYSAKFEFAEDDNIAYFKFCLLKSNGVFTEIYLHGELFERITIPYRNIKDNILKRLLLVFEPGNPIESERDSNTIYEIVKVDDWTGDLHDRIIYTPTGLFYRDYDEAKAVSDKMTLENTKTAFEAYIVQTRDLK